MTSKNGSLHLQQKSTLSLPKTERRMLTTQPSSSRSFFHGLNDVYSQDDHSPNLRLKGKDSCNLLVYDRNSSAAAVAAAAAQPKPIQKTSSLHLRSVSLLQQEHGHLSSSLSRKSPISRRGDGELSGSPAAAKLLPHKQPPLPPLPPAFAITNNRQKSPINNKPPQNLTKTFSDAGKIASSSFARPTLSRGQMTATPSKERMSQSRTPVSSSDEPSTSSSSSTRVRSNTQLQMTQFSASSPMSRKSGSGSGKSDDLTLIKQQAMVAGGGQDFLKQQQHSQYLLKASQQSQSYHNLQYYLQANGGGSAAADPLKYMETQQLRLPKNNEEHVRSQLLGAKSLSNKNISSSNTLTVSSAACHSTSKTSESSSSSSSSSSLSSSCRHCAEIEKESEIMKCILRRCKACSTGFLSQSGGSCSSNSSRSSTNIVVVAIETNGNQHQQQNMKVLSEKIASMRLQEQVAQLTKQLEQITSERDQLLSGNSSQIQGLTQLSKTHEANVKQLRQANEQLEKRLATYEGLKKEIETYLDEREEEEAHEGDKGSNGQEGAQTPREFFVECEFLKDFISYQFSSATPAASNLQQRFQNLPPADNETASAAVAFNFTIPSAVKALELVSRMKPIITANPFVDQKGGLHQQSF